MCFKEYLNKSVNTSSHFSPVAAQIARTTQSEVSLFSGFKLQDKGWKKHKAPYKKVNNTRQDYSLKEWVKKQNKAVLVLVDDDKHLTYAINHKIYDTWDCSDKIVNQYWTKD